MSNNVSNPKVGFVSLGCPKALVDSERILTQLRIDGYEIAPTYAGADVVVVNTCGFIDSARAESLHAIGEALNENGLTSEAHEYVNRIRARSNMNDLEVTAGRELNQDEFREQIKHERLVELCGEYLRFFDLKRWGEYGPQVAEDFTVPATGDVIARDPIFENFRINQDELFPIPLDELDLNPNLLPQNPGW